MSADGPFFFLLTLNPVNWKFKRETGQFCIQESDETLHLPGKFCCRLTFEKWKTEKMKILHSGWDVAQMIRSERGEQLTK